MNKSDLENRWLNNQNILLMSFAMVAFSLLVTLGVELLANQLFRLG